LALKEYHKQESGLLQMAEIATHFLLYDNYQKDDMLITGSGGEHIKKIDVIQ
jgi:hypothetical protein